MTLWKRCLACAGLAVMTMFLVNCGGSSSSSGSLEGSASGTPSTAGIALPIEVSAIPADTGVPTPTALSLFSQVRTLAAAANPPADSDYHQIHTAQYVDEPTLEVFGIIETILKATAQTHYADAGNVGTGPYACIVAWEDDEGGSEKKSLEKWIVDSKMAVEQGEDVNIVHIWTKSPEQKTMVEAKIYQAATQSSSGEYLNYGKWSIHAKFIGRNGFPLGGSFYAEADIDVSGKTTIRLHETLNEPWNIDGNQMLISEEIKAIMHKSPSEGYGLIKDVDDSICWDYDRETESSPCVNGQGTFVLPATYQQYAYDQEYLTLQEVDSDGNPVAGEPAEYKNRNDLVGMVYKYGLFDATTGTNVEKLKQFGFPITYVDGQNTRYGYYGAWQGRHQLWAGPDGSIPDGTQVTEEVWNSQTTARSFTSQTFDGVLSKRTLKPANLTQIEGIPLEIWLGEGFSLKYDNLNSRWERCDWDGQGNQVCVDAAYDMNNLIWTPDSRKNININRWDQNSQQNFDYWYDDTSSELKEADNSSWPPVLTETVLTPTDGDEIWVWISGATYIEYTTANGWEEKELLQFDEQTWTPEFAADNLGPFVMPMAMEYYVNNKGVNFIVSHVDTSGDDATDYQVKMELQEVARPNNAADFLAGVDYLAIPWEDVNSRSTYELDTNQASNTYLMLIYRSVGANDADKSIGDLVEQGMWGLQSYDAGDQQLANQFNWEYSANDGDWGSVSYLINNRTGNYVFLDDPILLEPVELTSMGGSTSTYSLQFDGWMFGLPDMHWELEKNDYEVTQELADKIVNIPEGYQVTDSATQKNYLVKPLEMGIVLATLANPPASPPSLAEASGLDLNSFTTPDWINFGEAPEGAELQYIEGKPSD